MSQLWAQNMDISRLPWVPLPVQISTMMITASAGFALFSALPAPEHIVDESRQGQGCEAGRSC